MQAIIDDIGNNTVLIMGLLSWILAQLIKFGLSIIIEKKVDLTLLTKSGGMPSAHSALVTSTTLGVGMQKGFDSPEFAITAVFALIVMYDAAGVRQAVGVQAQIMNELLYDIYRGSRFTPIRIKEILGHTPVEVLAGSILGLIVSLLL